jgi:hypothetical protein
MRNLLLLGLALGLTCLGTERANAQTSVVLRATNVPAETAGWHPYQLRLVQPAQERGALGVVALGGMAGWAVGLGAGAVAGFMFIDHDLEDFLAPGGIILGAHAGTALGAPLGVHLVNGRRGVFSGALLGSALLSYGGFQLVSRVDKPDRALMVAAGMAITQIGVSVAVEKLTGSLK